jgi:hypothetical protein
MREIHYRSPLFDVQPDGWDYFEDDKSFSEADRKNAADSPHRSMSATADNERNTCSASIISLSGMFDQSIAIMLHKQSFWMLKRFRYREA